MENTLDYYAHSNGFKNANSMLKMIFAIFTMIISLISTSPFVPISIAFLMSFLLIFKAKIPLRFYLKFMSIPVLFGVITFIFMAIFFGVYDPWFKLGLFNLMVYKDGFNIGFLVFSKILGGFSCLGFLALTTPMTEIFFILESMKIPKVVIEIAMMMYRYIFVFLDEARSMYNSQQTRLGYSTLKNSYRSMGMLLSNLFISVWTKGEKLYITMESRCYDGSIKTFNLQKNVGIKNILLLLSFEFLLLLGVYLTKDIKVI